jgi:hypothetical protein
MVNVDKKLSFFDGEKWDTSFEYIFNILPGFAMVARLARRLRTKRATTNTGILHFVQDDDFMKERGGDKCFGSG